MSHSHYTLRVYYEDTDSGGIVYHANYIKFIERARSELFFEQGSVPGDEGGGFVIRHLECDYLSPAKLGDVLIVKTAIRSLKAASAVMEQWIYRQEDYLHNEDDKLLFHARVKVAYLNEKGRPAKMDAKRLAVLKHYYVED